MYTTAIKDADREERRREYLYSLLKYLSDPNEEVFQILLSQSSSRGEERRFRAYVNMLVGGDYPTWRRFLKGIEGEDYFVYREGRGIISFDIHDFLPYAPKALYEIKEEIHEKIVIL